MPNGGRLVPVPSLRRNEDQQIERVTALILDATVSPPAGVVNASTLKLRRFIDTMAPRVKGTAHELLREDDPRRIAAARVADEATYRAKCLGPGDGLESAFTYCRSLATIVTELRSHWKKLDQSVGTEPGPGPCQADGARRHP
ncbi:DUF6415 family natural product biosynthesis protein [Streptomyces sp. NPDC002536]